METKLAASCCSGGVAWGGRQGGPAGGREVGGRLAWALACSTAVHYAIAWHRLRARAQRTCPPLPPPCSYGFAPPPGDNPHDGVQLRLSLRDDDPARAWKAAALARHGFATSQLFPLRMAAAPWELLHFAGLSVAEVGSAAEADALAVQLFERDDFPRELQPAALEAVIRACQAAQQAYPSSLDADRAELEALQQQQAAAAAGGASSGSSQAPVRRQQVLQVLIFERQVRERECAYLIGLWGLSGGPCGRPCVCWLCCCACPATLSCPGSLLPPLLPSRPLRRCWHAPFSSCSRSCGTCGAWQPGHDRCCCTARLLVKDGMQRK